MKYINTQKNLKTVMGKKEFIGTIVGNYCLSKHRRCN